MSYNTHEITSKIAHFTDARGDMAVVRVKMGGKTRIALITWGKNYTREMLTDVISGDYAVSKNSEYLERVIAFEI